MTFTGSSLSEMQSAVRKAIGLHWRIFLFHGVALIVLGALAVIAPAVATVAVEIFIGWLFLIGGIVGLVALFSADDVPAFLWTLLTAGLSVAVGVLLIWKPVAGVMSLMIGLLVVQIITVWALGIEPRHRSLEELKGEDVAPAVLKQVT